MILRHFTLLVTVKHQFGKLVNSSFVKDSGSYSDQLRKSIKEGPTLAIGVKSLPSLSVFWDIAEAGCNLCAIYLTCNETQYAATGSGQK